MFIAREERWCFDHGAGDFPGVASRSCAKRRIRR
jgi:hypothetical protein